MSDFDALRRRHVRDALALTPDLLAALDLPGDRLATEREARLRALVHLARERSPWHRRRLVAVDASAPYAELLAQLPVMTKDDLMDNFDEVVTDRRLTRHRVEGHLAGLPGSGYLLGRFTAVASSGSSGRRGCFVYDWSEWAVFYLACFRYLLRDAAAGHPGPVMASVAAGHPTHPTASLARTFAGPHLDMVKFPVTAPTAELVDGLNRCRPRVLGGYPSALHLLSDEARAGRLRIAPEKVVTYAEPLLPETRAALETTWGVAVGNLWGASEGGGLGVPCEEGRTHLAEDLMIIEVVDAAGRAVPAGVAGAKIYLTNLYNHTMPLIRYEITDEATLLEAACPCGSAHRCVADVQGRLDDYFDYGCTMVHPHVFRSALARHAQVVEYQVRQTARGADISVTCVHELDAASIAAALEEALRTLGVREPVVHVQVCERINRGVTGKLKRFVPLAPALVP